MPVFAKRFMQRLMIIAGLSSTLALAVTGAEVGQSWLERIGKQDYRLFVEGAPAEELYRTLAERYEVASVNEHETVVSSGQIKCGEKTSAEGSSAYRCIFSVSAEGRFEQTSEARPTAIIGVW